MVPSALAIDPDDRLLWRFRVRRLDAEALRDAMLAVSGALDGNFDGPYVPTVRDDAGEVPRQIGGRGRQSPLALLAAAAHANAQAC